MPRYAVHGKEFTRDSIVYPVRGLTYGPFPKNGAGHSLPEAEQVECDLGHIAINVRITKSRYWWESHGGSTLIS